jgi:putative addiction module component (TIGR02574 family)
MTVRDELLQRALSLTPADRAYLADQIEASLPQETSFDPTIADEWSQEIDRRLAAYDRGESTALEMDDVISRIRQALAARRVS